MKQSKKIRDSIIHALTKSYFNYCIFKRNQLFIKNAMSSTIGWVSDETGSKYRKMMKDLRQMNE